MRVRRFQASNVVKGPLLRDDPELVEAFAKVRLEGQLSRSLTGPRGGRYEPIGDIEYLGKAQVGDDWMRDEWTFAARREGRYVRPNRRQAAS